MNRRWWACIPLLLAVLAGVGGCATHADRLRDIRVAFDYNQLDLAASKIDTYAQKYDREANVWKLDRAMVELAAGRPREAERLLREVRDAFDHFEQTDVAEKAAVMLTDDTFSAYPGEDYEKVLIRAMLALSNLMSGGGDALAYALQTADKQEQIIQAGADSSGENPKLTYKRVALGPYLDGVLQEATHRDYDDAARSFIKVCSWEEQFAPGKSDVARVQHGRHSAPGNGVVYVFALLGRGPHKVETVELPSTVALLVADRILSATTKHTLPPNIAPVKVPAVVVTANTTRQVLASVDRQPAGQTATITDVSRLAAQQYEAIYPRVIARAVVRRVVKKGVVYGAKEVTHVGNDNLINVAMDVGGVIWEASESADTRCWGLLPDQIQVLRLEVPAGEHVIGLRPDDPLNGSHEYQQTVRVADGRNSYVLANFIDGRLVGNILASEP